MHADDLILLLRRDKPQVMASVIAPCTPRPINIHSQHRPEEAYKEDNAEDSTCACDTARNDSSMIERGQEASQDLSPKRLWNGSSLAFRCG